MYTVELLQKQPSQFGIRPVVGIVEFRSQDEPQCDTLSKIESAEVPFVYRWIHSPANVMEGDLESMATQIATNLSQSQLVGTVGEFDWETS